MHFVLKLWFPARSGEYKLLKVVKDEQIQLNQKILPIPVFYLGTVPLTVIIEGEVR